MEAEKKQIRFAKLVEASGRPETATLWTTPKQDRAFAKAIQANRVVTVVQKPTGTKKDFGTVGFHQQAFALYLIFPRAVLEESGTRVIGIDYKLIREPEGKNVPKAQLAKVSVKKTKQRPTGKNFKVRVVRRVTVDFSVAARSKAAAKKKALEAIRSQPLDAPDGEVRNEVKAVDEKRSSK
jgi:hypothetical protein